MYTFINFWLHDTFKLQNTVRRPNGAYNGAYNVSLQITLHDCSIYSFHLAWKEYEVSHIYRSLYGASFKNIVIIIIESFGLNLFCLLARLHMLVVWSSRFFQWKIFTWGYKVSGCAYNRIITCSTWQWASVPTYWCMRQYSSRGAYSLRGACVAFAPKSAIIRYIPTQTLEEDKRGHLQSPGWQPILLVLWCLLCWFASFESIFRTLNILTETRGLFCSFSVSVFFFLFPRCLPEFQALYS